MITTYYKSIRPYICIYIDIIEEGENLLVKKFAFYLNYSQDFIDKIWWNFSKFEPKSTVKMAKSKLKNQVL